MKWNERGAFGKRLKESNIIVKQFRRTKSTEAWNDGDGAAER